ncbi:YcjX family GTP-binding protein [Flexibacterium corallicola]|uniref:YcjX family protein n=1 Tax=Flexibacterium corallicola TaxID=3037259 RepID=UPI00286F6339|nr:YcjX family protein [Pseudovibrio sp. M1P-2-3]
MIKLSKIISESKIALDTIGETASDLATPSVRLGVTGLSRSGKTVFISALVHNLIAGGRLPLLSAVARGRLEKAYLQPQPDDTVPRFDYETHIGLLAKDRVWPQSTHQVSELRLTIEFESASYLQRKLGRGKLNLDIIDYPGEWLLDLPLLNQSFKQFSTNALQRARQHPELSKDFLELLEKHKGAIDLEASEEVARQLAKTFTAYLGKCRGEDHALSMLPPGRFLMPGDMEGSPALTFAPLELKHDAGSAQAGSLRALMEKRYEAYRKYVVRPFFKNHFAKLDRQIVLVDALQALNAGPAAVEDLNTALTQILSAFRPGKASWLASILRHRIDKIVFAATKADHLQKEDHDKLQVLLRKLVDGAISRAEFAGASVEVLALASVRATRQATVRQNSHAIPALIGVPMPGEVIDNIRFDGNEEAAIFPGDLPEDLESLFRQAQDRQSLKYVRFRPPELEETAEGFRLSLPHIRLDRALEFLLGDKLS